MNADNVDKLTHRIFSNSRMELDFFMYLPSGELRSKGSIMDIKINPILMLRYKQKDYLSEEYDYNKSVFKITPRNLYGVIKFLNTTMEWLYTDKYSDLFLMDENNNIIFNADYNKLYAATHKGDYDQCIMKAVPSVVKLGEKSYEGIHLFINTSNYCIPLTHQEVAILYGILKDFRFSEEIASVLEAYRYIKDNDCISTVTYNSKGIKTPFD